MYFGVVMGGEPVCRLNRDFRDRRLLNRIIYEKYDNRQSHSAHALPEGSTHPRFHLPVDEGEKCLP